MSENRGLLRKNAVLNIMRSILEMVFSLVFTSYATHVLDTEDFGKYKYTYSIVFYFVIVALLDLRPYGIREGAKVRNDKKKITELLSELISINFISVLLSSAAFVIFLALGFPGKRYLPTALVLGGIIVLTSLCMEWIYTIFEDYLFLFCQCLLGGTASILYMLLFVKEPKDYMQFVVAMTVGVGVRGVLGVLYVRRYIHLRLKFSGMKKHVLPVLRLFLSTLVTTLFCSADLTMLGVLTNDEQVAYYGISSKVYMAVRTLIGSLVMVAAPRFAVLIGNDKRDEGEKMSGEMLDVLLMLSIPAAVGMGMLSKDIIAFLAGGGYSEANASLAVLSVAFPFAAISAYALDAVLVNLKKDKEILAIVSIGAIVNLVMNYFAISYRGIVGASITTVFSEALVCILALYKSNRLVPLTWSKKSLLTDLLGALLIVLICILSDSIGFPLVFGIVWKITVSAVIYFGLHFFVQRWGKNRSL